jgi:hypothetical protein
MAHRAIFIFYFNKKAFSDNYKIFKEYLILMNFLLPKEDLTIKKKEINNLEITINLLLSLFGVRSFLVVHKISSI